MVFGVGAGAIAAMTTIFFSRYFNNPAWSGDFNELFLFSAAVAVAAAAAYPAAALLARGVTRQGGTTAENADKADTTKRNDDEPSGPG